MENVMLNFKFDWNIRGEDTSFLSLFLVILLLGFTASIEAHSASNTANEDKIKTKRKISKTGVQPGICGGGNSAIEGCWDPTFTLSMNQGDLGVVGVHMSVLPNGKVIVWDSRGLNGSGHATNARIWNPVNDQKEAVPFSIPGEKCNVFCSGHSFLDDGRLFVSGGIDNNAFGAGIKEAAIFNYNTNQWTPLPAKMNNGRWYPTNLTLGNGDVLTWAGTYRSPTPSNPDAYEINKVPQVLQKQFDGSFAWRSLNIKNPEMTSMYYSWLYLLSTGKVFVIDDAHLKSHILSVGEKFKYPKDFLYQYPYDPAPAFAPWFKQPTDPHDAGSSVMYDKDKILVVGGADLPKRTAEVINFTDPSPKWKRVGRLNIGRRHLNATLLPDGKVLVNGGNEGPGFNNNCTTYYVKAAEMWNPAVPGEPGPNQWGEDGFWTAMASATQPRLYHSAAVLLPDGRVLTGGTTDEPEQVCPPLINGQPNPNYNNCKTACPKITHNFTYEIFSPPYLFDGNGNRRTVRPTIGNGPDQVKYGETVQYGFSNASAVSTVRLIRLPSVTHSFNQNQGVVKLIHTVTGQNFQISIPVNRNECPPGHYMMFILDSSGVPSEAKIIQVKEN